MAYGAIMGQALATSGGISPFGMCGPLTCYVGDGNYTFTAQMKGKYKVTAVSGGGNGGDGEYTQGSNKDYFCSGSGGGSGAIAIFQIDLEINENIVISISNKEVNINSGQVICTPGSNGSNGGFYDSNEDTPPIGGAGGTITASIDLLYSVNGIKGKDGVIERYNNNAQDYTQPTRGGGLPVVVYYPAMYKGKLGIYLNEPIDGGQTYVGSTNPDDADARKLSTPAYGGYCGSGGDGSISFNNYSSSAFIRGDHGTGGPAAVIIEYLGDF